MRCVDRSWCAQLARHMMTALDKKTNLEVTKLQHEQFKSTGSAVVVSLLVCHSIERSECLGFRKSLP